MPSRDRNLVVGTGPRFHRLIRDGAHIEEAVEVSPPIPLCPVTTFTQA
jgi:hypothetical protein